MNNKKMNKKGFTIVELVIVIAVIAILAGVMIPTFGGIIKSANESAEAQKVASYYKEALAEALKDGSFKNGDSVVAGGYKYTFAVDASGAVTGCKVCTETDTKYNYTYDAGKWTAAKVETSTNVHVSAAGQTCGQCGVTNS